MDLGLTWGRLGKGLGPIPRSLTPAASHAPQPAFPPAPWAVAALSMIAAAFAGHCGRVPCLAEPDDSGEGARLVALDEGGRRDVVLSEEAPVSELILWPFDEAGGVNNMASYEARGRAESPRSSARRPFLYHAGNINKSDNSENQNHDFRHSGHRAPESHNNLCSQI